MTGSQPREAQVQRASLHLRCSLFSYIASILGPLRNSRMQQCAIHGFHHQCKAWCDRKRPLPHLQQHIDHSRRHMDWEGACVGRHEPLRRVQQRWQPSIQQVLVQLRRVRGQQQLEAAQLQLQRIGSSSSRSRSRSSRMGRVVPNWLHVSARARNLPPIPASVGACVLHALLLHSAG